MKIKALQNANTRLGGPYTTFQLGTGILSGQEIDNVKPVPGEEVTPGNNIWYWDRNNSYWWSGLFQQLPSDIERQQYTIDFLALANSPQKLSTYHLLPEINIAQLWNAMNTAGRGINVAILDTGIDYNHPDLKDKIIDSWNFINNTPDASDTDGHGTQMAGIIAASGTTYVGGVSPESKLYIAKVMEDEGGWQLSTSTLTNAISVINQLDYIDVISISIAYLEDDGQFYNALKRCALNGKIIVAAIGNYSGLPSNYDIYPAKYNDACLGVGAFDQDYQILANCNQRSYLQLLAPGKDILTALLKGTTTFAQNSSIATAFTSGVFALFKSYGHGKNEEVNIDYLKRLYSDGNNDNYALLKPQNMFNLAK